MYICVWNGYDGDSEILNELVRHTALKHWIANPHFSNADEISFSVESIQSSYNYYW